MHRSDPEPGIYNKKQRHVPGSDRSKPLFFMPVSEPYSLLREAITKLRIVNTLCCAQGAVALSEGSKPTLLRHAPSLYAAAAKAA